MCEFAEYDSEKGIYNCKIIGDECLFILPDKKRCDEIFGPDSEDEK